MRAGKLNQRISFEEPAPDQSGSGSEVITFTPRLTVWAAIEPLNGRERLQAEAITADIDVRIRTRWLPFFDAVTAKWRCRHVEKGTIYNIIAPPANIDMADREVEFMANTGRNQG